MIQFLVRVSPVSGETLGRLKVPKNILVQRRFPTYDFVLETRLSVAEASATLEHFLSHQERPRGFVLMDPRVDGAVSGATFVLRRRESVLGGSVAPYADGYFVPGDGGSTVFVRVQVSAWSWLFVFPVLLGVLSIFDFSFTFEAVGAVVLAALFLLALSCGPIWAEASEIGKLLTKLLCPPSAA